MKWSYSKGKPNVWGVESTKRNYKEEPSNTHDVTLIW